MTALDERIAPAVQPRPSGRRASAPRTTRHDRLVAESNRLLDVALSTEMDARDALGEFIGALINADAAPGSSLPKQSVLELIAHTADSLGCPPAAPAKTARRAR